MTKQMKKLEDEVRDKLGTYYHEMETMGDRIEKLKKQELKPEKYSEKVKEIFAEHLTSLYRDILEGQK